MRIEALRLPEDGESILPLLAVRPQQPYAAYPEARAHSSYLAFSVDRCLRVLEGPGSHGLVAKQDGRTHGVACWSSLPWDSAQFGFPAARVDWMTACGGYPEARRTETQMLARLLEQAGGKGVRHMTARVEAGDTPAIHALGELGFELIDGIQTFALPLGAPVDASVNGLFVRLFRERDMDEVLEIARTAYIYDRFHADAALPAETADGLHEDWVRNSCLGTAADAVVVVGQEERVLGYVTCKVDGEAGARLGILFGTIVLVATSAAARNRGLAKAATVGALDWFRRQGVQIVEVGTQLRNIPASRLYARLGFRLVGNSLTFRKLLSQ